MRILVFTESFPYTSETFILNHIKGLIDRGIEVKIIALNKPLNQQLHPIYIDYGLDRIVSYKYQLSNNYFKRFVTGIKIFRRSYKINPLATIKTLNPFLFGLNALKLISLYEASIFIQNQNFDIIHCHYGTNSNKLLYYYQKLRLKINNIVTSFHGYDVDANHIRNSKSYYNLLKKYGSLYFSNSLYTKSRLIDWGFDESKIFVVPVSLDTNYFKRNLSCLKKSDNRIGLITVARLVEFKGIEYVLKALQILKMRGITDFIYYIIGDGPLKSELSFFIKQLGFENNVFLLGGLSQNEIKSYLEKSDIFLLTGINSCDGRVENQGLVIQEAQAMNLPVIVSNVGGISEGMIPDQTGLLIDEKDIDQIAVSILKLMEDIGLRDKFGKRGREFVEDKYSIKSITQIHIDHYNSLLQKDTV